MGSRQSRCQMLPSCNSKITCGNQLQQRRNCCELSDLTATGCCLTWVINSAFPVPALCKIMHALDAITIISEILADAEQPLLHCCSAATQKATGHPTNGAATASVNHSCLHTSCAVHLCDMFSASRFMISMATSRNCISS